MYETSIKVGKRNLYYASLENIQNSPYGYILIVNLLKKVFYFPYSIGIHEYGQMGTFNVKTSSYRTG